jgi:hypothetical protein
MASYVERIRSIRDALETTADNIEDRDNISEDSQERADVYRETVEHLDNAIGAMEQLD